MPSTTVPCPTCSKFLRVPEDRVIVANCPFCNDSFTVAHGRVDGRADQSPPRQEKQRTEDRSRTDAKDEFGPTVITGPDGETYARKPTRDREGPWHAQLASRIGLGLGVLVISMIGYHVFLVQGRVLNALRDNPTLLGVEAYEEEYGSSPEVTDLRDSLRIAEAAASDAAACATTNCNCQHLTDLSLYSLAQNGRKRAAVALEECLYREAVKGNSPTLIDRYADLYPSSDRLPAVLRARGQVFRNALVRYNAAHPDTETDDQRFFRAALQHIADSGNNRLGIHFTASEELKDWQDYDAAVLERTDQLFALNNIMEETDYPAPSEQPPGRIRNFVTRNTGSFEKKLIEAVQAKMDDLFGAGLLRVGYLSPNELESFDGVRMDIDYTVSTLEEDDGNGLRFPSLYVWTQTETNALGLPATLTREERIAFRKMYEEGDDLTRRSLVEMYPTLLLIDPETMPEEPERKGTFKSYLLATSIAWDLRMTYPGASRPYRYRETSRPRANISSVQSTDEAYRRMLETSFDNFSLSFLSRFGVE